MRTTAFKPWFEKRSFLQKRLVFEASRTKFLKFGCFASINYLNDKKLAYTKGLKGTHDEGNFENNLKESAPGQLAYMNPWVLA